MERNFEYINNVLKTLRRTRDALRLNRGMLVSSSERNTEEYKKILESNQALIDKNNNMIEYWNNIIKKHSTVDSRCIGAFIAELISIFEDKEYVYQDALYNKKESIRVFDFREEVNKKYYPKVVIDKDCRLDVYNSDTDDSDLQKYVDLGNALLLSSYNSSQSDVITLFSLNKENLCIEPTFDLGRFGYVLDFIKNVTEYSLCGGNVNFDSVDNIMIEFLLNSLTDEKLKKLEKK